MGSTTNNTLSTNRPIIPTTKQLLYIDVIVVKSLQKRLESIEDRKVPFVALLIRIAQRLHGIENAHVHILSRNDSLQHALTRQITAPIVREILRRHDGRMGIERSPGRYRVEWLAYLNIEDD